MDPSCSERVYGGCLALLSYLRVIHLSCPRSGSSITGEQPPPLSGLSLTDPMLVVPNMHSFINP